VRAADTFGAGEGAPALLFLTGGVNMGEPATVCAGPGQAAAIPTGGMLPEGTDAAVMVEHTVCPGVGLVEILRPVAPGENVVRVGEDVSRGATVFSAGRRLTAAGLGVLAAVGVTRPRCRPAPRVGIIPTGDEIVPAAAGDLRPGQVRDITSVALAALVAGDGGKAYLEGVVPDDPDEFDRVLAAAVSTFDLICVLGGSSVGARDHTARAIDKLGPPGVVFHGLTLKPGKPTIYGLAGGPRKVPVFGLPGHPVSALVVYRLVVRPALRILSGEIPPAWKEAPGDAPVEPVLTARLSEAVSSDQGRDEYLCVHLVWSQGLLVAEPAPGKSGLITMLAGADGLVHIPAGCRGLEGGAMVEVIPLD
jgi:molybdopterin molybdotransferase